MFSSLSLVQSMYDSSYSYSSDLSTTDAEAAAGILMLMLILLVPFIILGILGIIGMWKTFEKAGKPGWAAIVPIYNSMVLAEVAGRPNWWGLGMLISPINTVLAIVFGIDIAKRFGKSDLFGVVALGLFGFVGYMMLGFGKDKYQEHPKAS